MKNKKLLYLLVPAVIAIWGYVGFSIFGHLDKAGKYAAVEFYNEVQADSDTIVETYQLLANYRDPFQGRRWVGTGNNNETKPKKPNLQNERLNQYQNRINWPDINYLGVITNNKNWVALLRINNSNVLMKEGDEEMKIMLIKLYPDSVILKLDKEQKTILKNIAPSE